MPEWLTLDEVLGLHHEMIERYGGTHGLRDPDGLDSALAQPSAEMFGQMLHETIFDQAAAYLFHIDHAQAFVEGNKRTALTAALTFLRLNGVTVGLEIAEAIDLGLRVARGELSKTQIAALLEAGVESDER